eukprot:scaffold205876_cov21-Tisochrysis_lutea.AAC.1
MWASAAASSLEVSSSRSRNLKKLSPPWPVKYNTTSESGPVVSRRESGVPGSTRSVSTRRKVSTVTSSPRYSTRASHGRRSSLTSVAWRIAPAAALRASHACSPASISTIRESGTRCSRAAQRSARAFAVCR